MAPVEPELVEPDLNKPGDLHRGFLAWRLPAGCAVLSSAPVGGGTQVESNWILNIGVASDFARVDLDAYVAEVAAELELDGAGVGLLTAAHVSLVQRAAVEGAVVDATVGIGKPTWAADDDGGWNAYAPGTINIVVQVPVALSAAAAVNVVMTVTEAKTQALFEAGVPGTGTASDAVVIVSRTHASVGASEPEAFGGPRSLWGARIALATREAVAAGIEAAQPLISDAS
jgi:adenosylcobinamide amidohydrolase